MDMIIVFKYFKCGWVKFCGVDGENKESDEGRGRQIRGALYKARCR